jgi:Holliday junction resolvase-like predicted endonuclease
MKFCPKCGASIKVPDPKFCSECGADIGYNIDLPPPPPEDQEPVQEPPAPSQRTKPAVIEELESIRYKAYDLGVRLEDTTASIFEKMGYSVEKRRRLPTRSGATAEIDLVLRRGNRTIAVECKNYDPSRSVGVSELRIFKDKLSDIGIFSGVFVTNTYFSEDSQQLADSVGIELWDGDKYKEMFFSYSIGRIRNPNLLHDPILPLYLDFTGASSLSYRNIHAIRLFSAVLFYHPYAIVNYRLHSERRDPTGKSHKVMDEGTYFVDTLDGDIINRERGMIENLTGIFQKKEKRLESREDKMVSEDLGAIAPISVSVLQSDNYHVTIAEPEVSMENATRIVKSHVIEKNRKDVRYNVKVRGETVTRTLKIVPRLNEVAIRGTRFVYVPKWNLEYEAGQLSFSRRILGSSARSLEDDLAKCRKCTLLMRRDTIAVCELCGIPLCDKHAYQEGRWLCYDHTSEGLRQQNKGTGFLSAFR